MYTDHTKKDTHGTTCDSCETKEEKHHIFNKKNATIVSGVLLGIAYLTEFSTLDPRIVATLYLLSIVSGGIFVFRSAITGLLKQRFLNINFLVAIASVGALYIGQYTEAAAVVFFFMLAEFFEDLGVERSRRALESLLKRSPKTAILANGEKVSVNSVAIGDIVIIRPGDLIPLDGKVIKGLSSVDEATITGESIPADKRVDNIVFAGTLNLNGYLEILVTKTSKDSTFSKIIDLVEKAQASRAPTQEFIDQFAKYYTPTVVAASFLLAIIPPLILAEPFDVWMYRALVLLVIACPCALVISTPVAIASAIGGASNKGIIIKGGKYLELLGKVKIVAFDKTRTLTYGQPIVTDIVTFEGFSEEEVLADAAGIETFSSHPLSQSILEFAQNKGITPHLMEKYEDIAGKGGKASCLACNDLEHCVGNLKMIKAHSSVTQKVLDEVEALERQGKTVVLISKGSSVMGALAISDQLRKESGDAIKKLDRMNIETVMLTGDNAHTARYTADKLGIKNIYASLLPDEKVGKIEELKNKYQTVAMVGDGVNDAPSLITATVGIAMGAGGSDVAIESADVALMNDNIANVPFAIMLGKKTLRTVKQNIITALGTKIVVMVLAIFGLIHLEWAIGADSGVAALVILNSLRLFKS